MVKNMGRKICPKCGQRYSYIDRKKVGDQVYLYAVHYFEVGGKRKVRKCYLGPEKGYIYMTKTYEIALKSLDRERILNYLDSLLNPLITEGKSLDEGTKRKIIEKLRKTIEVLEKDE